MIDRIIEPRTSSVLPSAAVLSFSPLHRDARVQRQIRALRSICRVTAFGFTDPGIEGVQFVDASRRQLSMPRKALKAIQLKARLFGAVYDSEEAVRKTAAALENHDFDLIVANDIHTLPVALTNRRQAKILFDAHEYAPRQFESSYLWRHLFQTYQEHLCRTGIPQADAMTTVGPAIAEEYARVFGVRPAVVLSAPYYQAVRCEPRHDSTIRMVHHGSATRARRLEVMIDAMALLDERYRLDFMLIPNDSRYLSELQKRASSNPRIAFIPPVEPERIVETISGHDVGLCAYKPHSFNGYYALTNKFLDAIQARLCIVINPLEEMKKLVDKFDCGVIASDYTPRALAETLRALDRPRVEACRRAADAAAAELCYEKSAEVLLDIVRDLLGLGADEEPNRDAVPVRG